MSERDATVYSVSSLTAALKGLIASSPLSAVFVEGELSTWRVYASGHAYFTLKDATAVLNCVMFARSLALAPVRDKLRDGVKVRLWGQLDVYAPRGGYQLIVRQVWLLEEKGDLAARFEALKRRFAAEGLFDSSRKKPLPSLPHRIGVVTSADGAAWHDIQRVLFARYPNVELRLYPSRVQGVGASEEIAAGIAYFECCEDWRADVLIVGRGGGSLEDLWAFNEEPVVRAVARAQIPIVSAVGHEPDFSLCDFVADVRAATPSNAAEIVVPEKAVLLQRLDDLQRRLVRAPIARSEFWSQRLDDLSHRLVAALRQRVQVYAARVQDAATRLRLLDPYAVLTRGYAIATDEAGHVLKCAQDVARGAHVHTRLAQGTIESVVMGIRESARESSQE